ncbi:hypothetical protein QF031_003385 [Pseudarthrobacter defluvii]|nr:hypothetical protein [Pseudarthrobacter defluvii]
MPLRPGSDAPVTAVSPMVARGQNRAISTPTHPREIQAGGEASDLAWFPPDDLPSPIVPHEHQVLSSLRSGLPAIVSFGFC